MRFARQTPEAMVLEITPALAKEMLDTSPGNRRLRGWYVELLGAAMKRGEWRVTSQGIGFDVAGQLRDAHHRLHACIKYDTPFQSVVVFGMRKDAYEVTDIGMIRTYSDRLNESRGVSDVLRLGCSYVLCTAKPTIDQMKPIIDAGLGDAARALVQYCGTKRKYYSSAAMKLAACITIMNGGDADFVLQQYRAMVVLDFENMSKSAQALVRQVDNGKASANETRETLARGFKVFDKDRHGISKIQVTDADIDAAVEFVRSVLLNSVAVNQKKSRSSPETEELKKALKSIGYPRNLTQRTHP